MPARRLRTAHVALAVAFVGLGAVDGVWTARLPALKDRLGLDSGELGIVIFSVSIAATVSLPLAGWLASHRGSRGPTGLGLVVASVGLTLAAFAPSLAVLVAAACILGAGVGILDVSANAHGVAVEQRLERPVLSALHGAWSFGLLGGSGIAAIAAAAGFGPRAVFPAVAAGAVLVAAFVVPKLLPGVEDAAVGTARFAFPRGALALPALLTFCCMFVESSTMNWAAVFLSGPAHTSAAVAAAGVVAFAIAMALARLVGDRFVGRWGFGALARTGGLLTFAGMLLVIATRSPVPSLAGFALVGAGCAAIVPALFRIAAAAPGISSGAGIAAVATAGYTGGVINGPSVGFLARGVGLTGALGLVAAAGLGIALLGPRLQR
jgi:predicted MFS family arabinose efflux permease